MKFTQTEPCKQCPFRRKSPAGWLGDAAPQEFIEATMADELMPCHTTVNYDRKDWQEEMMTEKSKVQHCAGARILYRNQCKRSKDATYMAADRAGKVVEVEPSKDVFTTKDEFLTHHNRENA